jgi:hypothetical protein
MPTTRGFKSLWLILAVALCWGGTALAKKKESCETKCKRVMEQCMKNCEKVRDKSPDPEAVYKCKEMACKKLGPEHCMKRCREKQDKNK